MIDVKPCLDNVVSTLSEVTDEELLTLQHLIERTHIHLMIERALRSGDRMSATIRSLGSD